MSDDKHTTSNSKTDPAAARRRRQAEALRANLRRRKAADEGGTAPGRGNTGTDSNKPDKPHGEGA